MSDGPPLATTSDDALLDSVAKFLDPGLQAALRDAFGERARVEGDLRAALKREQEARAKAEASDAFKDVFLGVLGHDLRNPLNTVLTTARVMAMGENLPADVSKKLGRMIAGGVRMQRMLDQVLDLSRVRLAGGILVERGEPRDLAPLVSDIVEETRAAHPTRTIELSTSASMARVDADRFEQVVSSLLENALVHGAPDEPVRVELAPRGAFVTLRVHNAGAPVDAASLEHLFKPFQRGLRPRTGKGGLGLGLYISERIVTAHGGSIKVESDATSGTTFEACFPCG